jgi:unsaturated rhamnogalacturonyl hydrolase
VADRDPWILQQAIVVRLGPVKPVQAILRALSDMPPPEGDQEQPKGGKMRKVNVLDVTRRVIRYTVEHPYERDYWEKAPALTGALTWGDVEFVRAVTPWVDRAVETQTGNGDLNYTDSLDLPAGHVRTFTPTSTLPSSLGYPLLLLYQKTKDKAYLEAAKMQMGALLRTPRTSEGGFWARKEGPELWIDFLYMMCPFLVLYGQITKDSAYIEEALKQYEIHVGHLVDPFESLARHAWCEKPNHYPQSTLWARGNGWLICCSVDMLSLIGKHKKRDFVAATAKKVITAMAARQDRSGYFHHILDDENSKLEASGTLMFAYAAARAVQLGLLDDSYTKRALRALNAVAGSVDESGAVPGVAVPPGGPGVPFGTTLFGQGFFILATHALREHLQS